MAVNSKAIELLFGVAGGSSISGETGQEINRDLSALVKAFNANKSFKIQFSLDDSVIKRQIENIKKDLQGITSSGGGSPGSGGGSSNGSGSGASSAHSEAWKNASASLSKYYDLQMRVQQAMSRTTDIVANSDGTFSTSNQRWEQLVTQTNQAKAAFETFNQTSSRVNMSLEERVNIDNRINDAEARLALNAKNVSASGQAAWSNLTAKVHEYINRVEYSANRNDEAKNKLRELRQMANGTDWRGYDALKQKLGEVQSYINNNSLATETWYQRMLKTFGTRVRSLLAGLILAKVTQYLREIYKNVVDIDTALTNLKIVTKENENAIKKYSETVAASAKRIGASISDLINSTTTYARLGFSLDDAAKFAELTTAYSKVADVTVDEATKNITALVKAYNVGSDSLEDALDKMMYVGRRYAISSAELGEGLNNAASSLYANKNSMEQALGMLAAANASTQNISKASTGLRTIAARLSAAKTVLEENGDDTEGMAESVVKLEAALKAYGIAVRDSNKDMLSTYEVLDQIAAKWSELKDDERQAIVNMAAGTRQQDIFNSLMKNWKDAQSVVESVDSASGELANATATRLNSIQGKLDQFKAAFQEFSTDILNSGLVKFAIDMLNIVFNIANGTASIIKNIGGLKTALLAFVSVLAIAKGGLIAYNIQLRITAGYTAIIAFFQKIRRAVLMIIDIIPNAITAWKSYAAGVVSANTAMQATIPVVGLVLAAIAAVVAAMTLVGNATEESIDSNIAAADSAANLGNDIQELASNYFELKDAVDAGVKSQEEMIEAQNDLIDKLGLQRSEVKALAKEYGNYSDAVKQAMVDKLQAGSVDLFGAVNIRQSQLMSSAGNLPGRIGRTLGKEDFTADEIASFNTLIGMGFSGSYSNGELQPNGLYDDYNTLIIGAPGWDKAKTADDIVEIYKKLQDGLARIKKLYGSNNRIYQAVYDEYSRLSGPVENYINAISDANQNTAEQIMWSELIGREMPKTKEEFDVYRNAVISAATSSHDFVGSEQDIIDSVDEVMMKVRQLAKFYQAEDSQTGASFVAMTPAAHLDALQKKYDAITKALQEMEEQGYLSADSLQSLYELGLDQYVERTEDGFKIVSSALDDFVTSYINARAELYDNSAESQEDFLNLQAVLGTLSVTAITKYLDKEKKALNEQLNSYKELIDLRKELLKQYKDELDYQKELEKRQNKVSTLQTKYILSQLDTSASGRAKTRELQDELNTAQEELDEFTLEHAIDVITNELDNQYEEYKSLINGQLNTIEQSIQDLSSDATLSRFSQAIADALVSAGDKASDKTPEKKPDLDEDDDNGGSSSYRKAVEYFNANWTSGHFGDREFSASQLWHILYNTSTEEEQSKLDRMVDEYNANVAAKKGNNPANHSGEGNNPVNHSGGGDDRPSSGMTYEVAQIYGYTRGLSKEEWYKKYGYNTQLAEWRAGLYHSGGIVGNIATLKSTEEFAKLLKGEFVATPSMMQRFMGQTLPEMVSSPNKTNEFNAPLIAIQCDNVTQESLPRLEEIIDGAVQKIKKELDSGMSRSGYKKQVSKMII